MTAELDQALKEFDLSLVSALAETPIATLWQVQRRDGSEAVLKLYRRSDRGNESCGTSLLRAWADRGAVRIFGENDQGVLMEWLEGKPLSQIAHDGDPVRAVRLLAETAQTLHSPPAANLKGLRPLAEVFKSLFNVSFAPTCRTQLRSDLTTAKDIARDLFNKPVAPRPLHGDLHHSNVILTAAGPRVFDAKGYVGDPAFELANALRHPSDLAALVRAPAHTRFALKSYAEAMSVPQDRLARWAVAKCALSITWRAGGTVTEDSEADLLSLFLSLARS